MGGNTAEIIARLTLNGAQFSSENARIFGAMEAQARDTAGRTRAAFEGSFAQIQQIAAKALTMPRNAGGALDLNVAGAREAAAAANAQAIALREVAAAAEMAALKTGDTSENTRIYLQAARAAAIEAENTARSTNEQAASLDRLQNELNQTKSSTDAVVAGNRILNQSMVRGTSATRGQGMAMVQASQQVQDFFIQVGGGQAVMVAFAQQASQMAFVMQNAGGAAGRFAAFLSGPWGAAILGGTTLAGLFAGKMLTQSENQKEAEKTAEGLRKAILDLDDATAKHIRTREQSEALDIEEARTRATRIRDLRNETNAILQLALAREKFAQETNELRGGATSGLAASATGRRQEIEAELKRNQEALDAAERTLRNLGIPALERQVEGRVDPIARATNRYTNELARLREERGKGNITEAKFLELGEAALRLKQRQIKAAQDAQREERSDARTSREAFRDFEASLARRGVRPAPGRYGFRSTADQQDIHRAGLSPLDGVRRPSRHQTWQAFDPTRASHNEELARQAAMEAGLKGFKVVTESGGRKHYQWTGHGRKGDAEAMLEEQERAEEERLRRLKQVQEEQDRILHASREQLSVEAEGMRFLGLRIRGLDREAEVEARVAAAQREHAGRQAHLARLRAEAVALGNQAEVDRIDAESRVTEGLEAQIAALRRQADSYAELIGLNGDRATMTDEERAAEEAANAALLAQRDSLLALAKTDEDRIRIKIAMLRIDSQLTGAAQDAEKNSREQLRIAEEVFRKDVEAREREFEQQRESLQDLADFYHDALRTGGKSVWEDFEDEGMRVIAMLAAKWTMALLSGQKTSMGSILAELGSGQQGQGGIFGTLAGLLGGGKGGELQKAGGVFGGTGWPKDGSGPPQPMDEGKGAEIAGAMGGLGRAVPYIGAAMAATSILSSIFGVKNHAGGLFGFGGNLLINAITPAKRGSATLGFDPYGDLGVTSTRGNSRKRIEAASGAVGGLADSLERIAEALGGAIGGSASVSIGMRDGKWRVDPTGKGITKTKNGAIDFGEDEEAAIRYALGDALKDGIIQGISDASKKILASGQELERAIEKAAMIEDIPRRLAAQLDPVGYEIDEFNKKWVEAIAALKEGGASTEEIADAQRLYRLELDEVKASTRDAAADLKDFLAGLNFGSGSPYSLRDQERMAKEALQPFLDKIGMGEGIDQAKYQDAAQAFLDIERQMYGSTGAYFEAMDAIQAATGKAIAAIDNAKPIRTFADPFIEKTASNTQATAEILDQINQRSGNQEHLLASILNALSASGGFIGGGAGFSGATVRSA